MGKSLIRKNQLSTDIADLVGQYGSGFFISTSQTGSFTASLTGANVVYTTGNQTVSGLKNFITRPTVNGSGVLLIGEAAGGGTVLATGANIVYTTGDQTISGVKTFAGALYISGDPDGGNSYIKSLNNLLLLPSNTNHGIYLNDEGIDMGGPVNIYGSAIFDIRPLVNGTGVLLIGEETVGGSVSGVVYTTGDQTISGTKTFVSNTVLYSGVNVNFNTDTNVKFSGNVTFSNDRVWETGLVLGTNKYTIPYSGGSFSKVPKILTNLDVTGSTVFNYNITGRTVNGFGLLFSTTLTENATLMIRATV